MDHLHSRCLLCNKFLPRIRFDLIEHTTQTYVREFIASVTPSLSYTAWPLVAPIWGRPAEVLSKAFIARNVSCRFRVTYLRLRRRHGVQTDRDLDVVTMAREPQMDPSLRTWLGLIQLYDFGVSQLGRQPDAMLSVILQCKFAAWAAGYLAAFR